MTRNNSSKHDLAFLEQRRSPDDCIQGLADHGGVTHLATDDCIKTNREPIHVACSRTSGSNGSALSNILAAAALGKLTGLVFE